MTQKTYLKVFLLSALFFLTAGGFLLHFGIHQIMGANAKMVNFVPFTAGLVSVFVVITLFLFRKMISYAYLLNGMITIIGIITMASFSVHGQPYPLIPDIIILVSVFCIGKLLFELELTSEENLKKPRHHGRFIRFPNMGYWLVHLVGLSVVFTLGHIFW